jgi:hypothetical protein
VAIVSAQTAHSDQIIASPDTVVTPHKADTSKQSVVPGATVSPRNPWYTAGFQLGYRLGGNSAFSDDIIASGRTTILVLNDVFKLHESMLQVPVVGNIGRLTAALPSGSKELLNAATDLLNAAEGISVEIAPYLQTRDIDRPGDGNFGVTYYLSFGYRVNAARSRPDSSTLYLGQVRLALGAEFSIRLRDADPKPFTLSLGPTLTRFNKEQFQLATGRDKQVVLSWDVTMILPVSGFGLLSQASVAPHTYTLWRVGVLVAKKN